MKNKMLMGATALVALCAAGQVSAATGLGIDNLGGAEYDTIGFNLYGDVVFNGTVDDGAGTDDVTFEIWDDGIQLHGEVFKGTIGASNSFHFDLWFPGLIKQGATGVGLYLLEGGNIIFSNNSYNPPHLADPRAVPEPASWALLIGGFAMVGATLRTRQRRVQFA